MPKEWAFDTDRRKKAKVPEEVVFQTKPEIALVFSTAAGDWGIRSACVTADADYGDNPNFLAGLEKRRRHYVVAVRCDFAVVVAARRADATGRCPGGGPGGAVMADGDLAGGQQGLDARTVCGLAWLARDLVGTAAIGWLIGEDASDGKRRYYWSNFGPKVALVRMVEYAHRRHWVEQYHEEAKELLGWDQYQGRLWPGFHRQAVTVMLAYSFLVWQEFQQRQE